MPDIKSQTAEEIQARLAAWGEPVYRAGQILAWVYEKRATDWAQMTNLPRHLRERLAAHYTFSSLALIRKQGASDTTQKFLWRLADHSLIESVLIPANPALYSEPSDRHTLCVSSQVGCAYGCRFCASGLQGWKRNLKAEEIVDQVLAVERQHSLAIHDGLSSSARTSSLSRPEPLQSTSKAQAGLRLRTSESGVRTSAGLSSTRLVTNLVIMGMGEPLANYEHLLRALRILNASWGGGIGARKITISTSGLVPQIRKLADEPLQLGLAISLHGATDALRNRIMPINRKYPLAQLVAACEYYEQQKGRMLTFEYILIAGVNDGLDQVKPLANLARRLRAKINLIPYNTVDGLPWERPAEDVQDAFLHGLERLKVPVTLRREKGHEIDAACGQLRLRTEKEPAKAG